MPAEVEDQNMIVKSSTSKHLVPRRQNTSQYLSAVVLSFYVTLLLFFIYVCNSMQLSSLIINVYNEDIH